jgi:hypothetical protein
LPELVHETKKEIEEAGLLGTILGHVGDGESGLGQLGFFWSLKSLQRKLPRDVAIHFGGRTREGAKTRQVDG